MSGVVIERPVRAWRGILRSIFLALLSLTAGLVACGDASAQEGLCAVVSIQIQQKASLERQAFTAELDINNGLTTSAITGVGVNIVFTDANGNSVVATTDPNNTAASFFLRQDSLSGINATDGTGTVAPSTTAAMRWLIIPAPGSAGTSPAGALYWVGATLTYTLADQAQTVNVTPASITVLPQPQLQLDYFLPNDVYADDAFTAQVEPPVPFTLGVRVTNSGAGTAHDMRIDSAQPKIIDNQQGLLIGFQLLDSHVDDQPGANTLLINFGDIAPQQSRVGRWDMETTLSGQFIDFTASFTHADSLGGALTSLLSGVNTHTLIHDVLVDLAGRDKVLDFLARDADVPRVYESDGTNDSVVDVSANATIGTSNNGQTSLSFPAAAGLVYVQMPDPFHGQLASTSAVRSDGKTLPSANVWFSKTRNADHSWAYFINVFDTNSTGQYSFTGGGATNNGSLSGRVFDDIDGNGIQDINESGIGIVGVHLHGTTASATVDFDAATDSNGEYQFAGLGAGTYTLTVSALAQFNDGVATAGTAGGASATGSIQNISLTAGVGATGYQFAKIPQVSSAATTDYALSGFTLSASTIAVNDNVTLTATVSNLGPAADSGTVLFAIASGLNVATGVASSGSFDPVAHVWHVASLGSGASATLSVGLTAGTSGTKTITANAVVDAPATDPNSQNNIAHVDLTVNASTNITLGMSAPSTALTSGALAYNVALGNSGQTSSGTTVMVLDLLPVGVAYTSATIGPGVSAVACMGTTTLACAVTLTSGLAAGAPNGAASFTLNTTTPSVAGSITNFASVDPSGQTNPPAPGASCSPTTSCGSATTAVNTPPKFRLVKNSIGGDGSFNFAITGGATPANPVIATTSGTGQLALGSLAVGQSINITETPLTGWTQTSLTCSNARGGSAPVSLPVALAGDDDIICTFVNTAVSNVKLAKTAGAVVPLADGTYQLDYTLTVTNAGVGLATYGLVDSLQTSPNVQAVSGYPQITYSTSSSDGLQSSLGSYPTVVANETLASGKTDVFTVTLRFGVNPAVSATNDTCDASANHGLFNTATLSVVGGGSSSSNACVATPQPPQINLIATASLSTDANKNGKADVGDALGYRFDIANVGTVPLGNVTLIDDRVSGLTCANTTPSGAVFTQSKADLAAGDSVACTGSYTVAAADIANGRLDNSAIIAATGPLGELLAVAATATYEVNPATAGQIGVVESDVFNDTNGNGLFDTGETISYAYSVTNTGKTNLTNVGVLDTNAGVSAISCPLTSLSPGQSMRCISSYALTSADIQAGSVSTSAIANATPAGSSVPVTSSDTHIATSGVPAQLTVRKSATLGIDSNNDGQVDLGDTLRYTLVATNSGTQTLSQVVVSDDKLGTALTCATITVAGHPFGATLQAGDSVICQGSYVAVLSDVPQLVNIADAIGTTPYGLTLTGAASASVAVPPQPNLTATSSVALTTDRAQPGVGNVGDVLTFTVAITNSGNVALSSMKVADALLAGTLQCSPPLATDGQSGNLPVGASAVCTGTHTVTAQDVSQKIVTNTAAITGIAALTDTVASTQTQVSYSKTKK